MVASNDTPRRYHRQRRMVNGSGPLRLYGQQNQVVAVNDLVADFVTESRFDGAGMQPLDLGELDRPVVDQPAGELHGRWAKAGNAVAGAERALNVGDALG